MASSTANPKNVVAWSEATKQSRSYSGRLQKGDCFAALATRLLAKVISFVANSYWSQLDKVLNDDILIKNLTVD